MPNTQTDSARMKLLYLVIYASYGTTAVYRVLYFRRVGLDGTQIGLLIALEPLITLVAGPVWGVVADKLRLRSRLLTLVTGLSVLPMLAMIWTRAFLPLAGLTALYALIRSPVQPLMDSLTLTTLGPDRHRYPSIRAFGSLGYAPVTWLTGFLIQGNDIRWIFVGYAALMGAGCLLSLHMRIDDDALPTSIGGGLAALTGNRVWLLFMFAMLAAMMAQSAAFSYFGLYLDTLGASESLIGFSGAWGSVVQTALMLSVLPWMLRRWGSERMLLFSLSIYVLRLAIWALVPVPAVIAASQALNGLSFGAALVASVDFAARHAPEGLAATSQSLVTNLVSGLGRSLGGLVAGSLYDDIGPQGTFGVFSVISLLAALVFGTAGRRHTATSQARARESH